MYFSDLYCVPSVSIAIACLWAAEIGSDDLAEIQANQRWAQPSVEVLNMYKRILYKRFESIPFWWNDWNDPNMWSRWCLEWQHHGWTQDRQGRRTLFKWQPQVLLTEHFTTRNLASTYIEYVDISLYDISTKHSLTLVSLPAMVRKVRKVHEQGMCRSANGLQIQLYNWFLAPQTLRKVYAFGLTMSYTCVCI